MFLPIFDCSILIFWILRHTLISELGPFRLAGEYWESYRHTLHDEDDNRKNLPGDIRHDDLDGDRYNEEPDGRGDHVASANGGEDIGEVLLWQQLTQELERQQEEGQVQSASEEEAAAAREITEEEEHAVSTAASALSQVIYL